MRIVYLNPVGVLGGAERSLLDVMASLRQTDPAAELHLIVGSGGPLVEHAEQLGVQVSVLPMPSELLGLGDSAWKDRGRWRALLGLALQSPAAWGAWGYARQLGRELKDLRPDVVHSNGLKFHLLSCLANLGNMPVIWHIRDFLTPRPVMARALRWASRRARTAIVISRAVAQDARAVLTGLPVELVYNAIDTDYFSPGPGDGHQLDALAGLPTTRERTLRVGLVATYARWKGQDIFLEAAAQVLRDLPGLAARFYIVGGPIYQTRGSQFSEQQLRAKAAALRISQRVGFTGFQNGLAEIYRALDIVVHASTRPEPFGRTIVEAMACARPVVVSVAGGAAELFTAGHDALGAPPGNAAALADSIKRLSLNSQLRQQIAANARQTALTRFSRAHFGRQILSTYHRIAA